jgi:DNA-binding NarL/FixJ family response regulator
MSQLHSHFEPTTEASPATSAVLDGSPTGASDGDLLFAPLPGSAPPQRRIQTSLHSLTSDERAIAKLLETLLSRAGFSINEAARRLGVTPNAVRQYIRGRRNKPSLSWFLKLATLCGAKVSIEFPEK